VRLVKREVESTPPPSPSSSPVHATVLVTWSRGRPSSLSPRRITSVSATLQGWPTAKEVFLGQPNLLELEEPIKVCR
jgi:hypothetical protein